MRTVLEDGESERMFNMVDAGSSNVMLSFTEIGNGPPLVLVHGLWMTHEMFDIVLPGFSKSHRVICPDLRGYGESAGLGPPYTIPQMAKDVIELLDHLGIAQVDLLGYSEGGIIAECIAATYPSRVRRLVLACTYAYNQGSIREKLEAAIVPWIIRVLGKQRFLRFVFSRAAPELGVEVASRFTKIVARNDIQFMLITLHEANFFDARPLLPKIVAPTLVLAGGNDNGVPMHNSNELASGIKGANLEVLPEGRHTLIWTNPDYVTTMTEKFLQTPDEQLVNEMWTLKEDKYENQTEAVRWKGRKTDIDNK
jgi:3-oxoadipate enol-lactonase